MCIPGKPNRKSAHPAGWALFLQVMAFTTSASTSVSLVRSAEGQPAHWPSSFTYSTPSSKWSTWISPPWERRAGRTFSSSTASIRSMASCMMMFLLLLRGLGRGDVRADLPAAVVK